MAEKFNLSPGLLSPLSIVHCPLSIVSLSTAVIR